MREFYGTIAIQRYDRTEALLQNGTSIERMIVTHQLPTVSTHGLLAGVFEVAEIPLALYCRLRASGAPYVAIPVFPDRLLTESYVYTHPASGIETVSDLRGRRVILPMYFMTSSVWHRGMLFDDARIEAEEVEWITTSPERDSSVAPPPGVRCTLARGSFLGVDRLLDGTGDCLMTEGTPVVPANRRDEVHQVPRTSDITVRPRHAIVHVIAMKEEFAQAHPEVVLDMCRAFSKAKQSAYAILQNERLTSLPMMRAFLDETERVFGGDPWPYGADGQNAIDLRDFLRYARTQGLIQHDLTVEDLFDAAAVAFDWSSPMTRGAELESMESMLGLLP